MSDKINENEELNDDFLDKLTDTSTDIKPEVEKPKVEEKPVVKEENKEETFNKDMETLQAKPEEPLVSVEPAPKKEEAPIVEVEKVEEKPVKKPTKTKKKVSVVSSKEYELSKEEAAKKAQPKHENKVEIAEDLETTVTESNEKLINSETDQEEMDDIADSVLNEPIDSFIHKNYEDIDTLDKKDIKVEVVSPKEDPKAAEEFVEDVKDKISHEEKLKANHIYGGDGTVSAFKLRKSHVAKILSHIDIKDTASIDPIDISKRSDINNSEMYVKTVLPTLKPCYSVVPLIISGVVITMTAFSWPDIRDMCMIEEKIDDLDPEDEDYTYNKNQLFIEKREKQLDLFYDHIYSISGFSVKPSKEEFYGKIMKWPDFQQLFFAAYSATFQKSYDFELTCPRCGLIQPRSINPKNLCFMLNKNINIDSFNYYLQKGASIASNDDSMAVYNEFQKEKIVDRSNNTYRTIKPLSDSAIICTLRVPTVTAAMDMIRQIAEKFRDKELEHIYDDGTTVSIDSSFGVNDVKDLKELKRYLYINSLLVAQPNESEDKIEVGYLEFKDKDIILDTISKLSIVDYKEFVTDPNLNAITTISGIRHQFDAKTCDNQNCNQEMGLMAIEPEILFFIIAKQELPE